jgi:acetamidase/formamidase/NO-binding membrane sensor protein with MHYT domain
MSTHRLDPTPVTTRDVFSPEHPPALTVDPGDTVLAGSLDARGYLARQTFPGQERPTMFAGHRGHCLTGPIAVRGARPGDMLAVRLVSVRPGDWGWTVAPGRPDSPVARRLQLTERPGAWLLWELDPGAGNGTANGRFTRPLAPFLGVIGVAPGEPGEHSTIPPRVGSGGNIDCKDLVAGSVLYLPVNVPGALLYLGDGHAAQGDGEVGGTAIECPMTTEVVLDVVRDRPLPSIHADAPAGPVTFGFDADLNVAMGDALDAMVGWMAVMFGTARAEALALASTAVDMRVTQVANGTWGVHAVLPSGTLNRILRFADDVREPVTLWPPGPIARYSQPYFLRVKDVIRMVHANEFALGLLTPGLAFVMSCLGSFLGLSCASRARACTGTSRAGWLLLASASIGTAGIWVMHNIALLGFSITGQTIRYDVPLSILSAVVAMAVVFAALMIVGFGSERLLPLLLGGLVIGCGVLVSMDYVGMAAMKMPDAIHYNVWIVLLSVVVAVAAATFSLWAALRLRGLRAIAVASVAMGVAISGMHYTAMTAMSFTATPQDTNMLGGATKAEFVLPLVLTISVLTLILTTSIALFPNEEDIRAEAALSQRLARQELRQRGL